jgi:hypothetical protein
MTQPKKGVSKLADAGGKPQIGNRGSAIVDITDGSLGTASDAIAEITASYVEATIANAHATHAAKINEILAALRLHGLIAD